ncbi:MAG: thiamine pyrophosphate-dependent dehydrogenase E1 component subunit alpha [Planctomycetes bacterium]|nr:thiamine pyrophosphate-dependent dehydrogenase E1 component subunit alpha [Planctomycetota bacterium]
MASLELNKILYQQLYLIRMVEETIRLIYASDVIKTPVHLSLGEEAIVVGVCQALGPDDQVFGTYRSHALYLAKGGNLNAFWAELYGKVGGPAGGKAGSMHISAPDVGFMAASAIVASIIPMAMGSAFAAQYKREDRLTAVFFGDGATEEGVFWESLNIAVLKKLPMLFICENNKMAIHTHIKDRQSYNIPEAVRPFGLHVFTDRTTDSETIYHLTQKAIQVIRTTGCPAFLHLEYHRYLEHVGVNEDYCFGYRCKEDFLDWYERDPVKIQREKLRGLGIPEIEIRGMEESIDQAISKAVRQAEEEDFPNKDELLKDVHS